MIGVSKNWEMRGGSGGSRGGAQDDSRVEWWRAPPPPLQSEMPCVAESRDWPVLEEPDWGRVRWSPGGSAALWGCRSATAGEALSGRSPSPHHLRLPPPRLTGRRRCKSGALQTEQGEIFGVTMILTLILFKDGEKLNIDCSFPTKVQWCISVVFPFILLPEEQCQTHFQGIDIVHKRAVFFCVCCCFQCLWCSFFCVDSLDCRWSDFLFISAMIKPSEFLKVLVSSVCTVPNTRNTRRSTALGETPLIWYCARYPEPPDPPTVDSVSVGCVCGMQRGSVRYCVTL